MRAAALIVLSIIAYFPALGGGFIWDDRMYLTQGSLMRSPLWRLWFAPDAIDYLPLTYTLYRLQWSIWRDSATAFHAVNVLLHGGAVAMLWRVLRRLEVRGAWIAAAIFAVHPVCAESVAWVAEEKNPLSLLLAAVALLLYLDSNTRPRRYWPAVAAFALALCAKPAVIMLPVVLLLLAWWKRGAVARVDGLRSAPFFALSAVFAVVTIWYQQRAIGTERIPLGGLDTRVAQAIRAAWFYLSKLLVPRELIFFNPRWRHSGLDALTVASLVPLIALAALLWRMRARWGRGPLVALACYVAMLLPVLGLLDMAWMQFAPVADHYQYPAMIAPIALVVSAVANLARPRARVGRESMSHSGNARFAKVAHPAMAAAVIVVLGALTFMQARNYKGEDTLWRATIMRNPQAWAAWAGLGLTASERGDLTTAIANLKRAAELNPEYSAVHNNLGAAYQRSGDIKRALAEYSAAARINPELPEPQYNLGVLLIEQKRPAEAEPHLARAVELMPASAVAEVKLGSALLVQGKLEGAAQHLSHAAHMDPTSFEAHAYLAECLRKQGKSEQAFAEYQKAIALRGQ
ncbi:MAG: tetratricopeptide repeat protein [Acidobacteriia bacterium]|nr:tetratricopeptide repeat protein [Terriglobia bacterium]